MNQSNDEFGGFDPLSPGAPPPGATTFQGAELLGLEAFLPAHKGGRRIAAAASYLSSFMFLIIDLDLYLL